MIQNRARINVARKKVDWVPCLFILWDNVINLADISRCFRGAKGCAFLSVFVEDVVYFVCWALPDHGVERSSFARLPLLGQLICLCVYNSVQRDVFSCLTAFCCLYLGMRVCFQAPCFEEQSPLVTLWSGIKEVRTLVKPNRLALQLSFQSHVQ